MDKALRRCTYEIQIGSQITRDERSLNLGYELRDETMAWVYIPPGLNTRGDLHWVSPMGKGVIRLVSHRMEIEYVEFQINRENEYETCTGWMNTLEGSSLGLQFEVIFRGEGQPGARIGYFMLTDYVLAGQQRNPTVECIDKKDFEKSGGSGSSTQGGDMWGTLFFSVHRDPRDLKVTLEPPWETPIYLYKYDGPARDNILGVPVTEDSGILIINAPK